MAWPFSPLVSFLAGLTPKLTAAFLNALQSEGIAPAAAVAWATVPMVQVKSTDGSHIAYGAMQVMTKDATTQKYTFATLAAGSITASAYRPNPGTYPTNTWVYGYLYTDNGVAHVELSNVAPTADLLTQTGDVTRRYLFSCHSAAAAIDPFARSGRYTSCLALNYVFGDLSSPTTSFGSYTTAPITHDLTPYIPPTVQTVDVGVLAVAVGATSASHPYVLSIAGSGGYTGKFYVSNPNGVNTAWRFYLAGQGTSQALSSTVDDQTWSLGVLRVLGWEE